MILSFKQKKKNGEPTYFIEKIWRGLISAGIFNKYLKFNYEDKYVAKFDKLWDGWGDFPTPKLHTIREDKHGRWKPGMKIHFYVGSRTKNAFQFAPVVECKSVQKIEIEYLINLEIFKTSPLLPHPVSVEIDERSMSYDEIITLSKNDGFYSIDDFFDWFNTDFTGKIIHWTDFRY
jgi:hypothetical protein